MPLVTQSAGTAEQEVPFALLAANASSLRSAQGEIEECVECRMNAARAGIPYNRAPVE